MRAVVTAAHWSINGTILEIFPWPAVEVMAMMERPPRLIVDVITQAEYTHDVVVPYRGEIHLVYDTT